MNLARNLAAAMDRKGWNIATLSKKSGTKKQNISDWLAGRSPRNLIDLKKCAEALEVRGGIDELIFGSEALHSKKYSAQTASHLLGEFHDENGNIFRGRFEVSLVVKKLKD